LVRPCTKLLDILKGELDDRLLQDVGVATTIDFSILQ
jgi:hypothetical protein